MTAILLAVCLFGALVTVVIFRSRLSRLKTALRETEGHRQAWAARASAFEQENATLSRFRPIVDVEQEVPRVRATAQAEFANAQQQAAQVMYGAQQQAAQIAQSASQEAAQIRATAHGERATATEQA